MLFRVFLIRGFFTEVRNFSNTNYFGLDGICLTCRGKIRAEITVIPLTPTK